MLADIHHTPRDPAPRAGHVVLAKAALVTALALVVPVAVVSSLAGHVPLRGILISGLLIWGALSGAFLQRGARPVRTRSLGSGNGSRSGVPRANASSSGTIPV